MAIKRTRNSGLTVPELVKPRIGSDDDAWGGYLNSNIDKQSEFYTKLVQDSETQNQEITRLDREKVSISDVPTIVEPIVIQEVENTGKPMLDEYIEETIKPSIDTYTSGKKAELDNYVNLTSKPSLDSYEKEKEAELDLYTTSKKGELDSHTLEKQTQLDSYEKTKETELDNYTIQKETQLNDYTIVKKGELDEHTTIKKSELDNYTTVKESELDSHTLVKKGELDTYEKEKELELETYTSQKKSDLDSYEQEKELELDNHTETKKQEITSHTDSEILRIQGEGSTQIDKVIAEGNNQIEKIVGAGEGLTPRVDALEEDKLDKGGYEGTALDLKTLIDSKPSMSDSIPEMCSDEGSAGVSSLVSRADHVHPAQLNIDGNAGTSTKLQTARMINGTSFDGGSDIVTSSWGVNRNISIGDTSKNVDGSSDISWSLSEIGAAASSHTHNYAGSSSEGGAATTSLECTGNSSTATTLQTARTINGTSFNGSANITTANWGTARTLTIGSTGKSVNGSANISWSLSEIGAAASSHTHSYLSTSGGTISGNLTVTGAIVANGNITAYSDRRLKSNIEKIENSLEKIDAIGGYTFDMLGISQRQVGVIAQEVEKVLPEAIVQNENGYLSVDYGRIVGLLIEGIKDLKIIIEDLKQEIDELKGGK